MKWIELQEDAKTRFYWGSSRLLVVPGYGAFLQVKSPHFKEKFKFITLSLKDLQMDAEWEDISMDTLDEMPPVWVSREAVSG